MVKVEVTDDTFWNFVRAREEIRVRRLAGQKPPWTDDPILQKFHFCNVQRKHDHGTWWYMVNIVPAANATIRDLIFRTVLYRLVNNVTWFQQVGIFGLKGWKKKGGYWPRRVSRAPQPYSLAYPMALASGKGSHLEVVVRALDQMTKPEPLNSLARMSQHGEDLGAFHEKLQRIDGVGPFIALQIYRDLFLAESLPNMDEESFIHLGPGAQYFGKLIGKESYPEQYALCLNLWTGQPKDIQPPLLLGDIEHCMCETAKYVKRQEGRGRRRYYKPHG